MQLVEARIGESNQTTTYTLRNMKVSKSKALNVELSEAASIRTLISRLHKDTDLHFRTEKTGTGILVWRVK
jgi:hypothetical protein